MCERQLEKLEGDLLNLYSDAGQAVVVEALRTWDERHREPTLERVRDYLASQINCKRWRLGCDIKGARARVAYFLNSPGKAGSMDLSAAAVLAEVWSKPPSMAIVHCASAGARWNLFRLFVGEVNDGVMNAARRWLQETSPESWYCVFGACRSGLWYLARLVYKGRQ